MKAAPLPSFENDRLNVLREYEILYSNQDASFDELTALASEICEVPVSLISFLDADIQWIKSSHGIDLKESSRDVAFCSHAILNPTEIFEIDDSRKDERFHDNPFVTSTDTKLVFYAGVPLLDDSGLPLGTLCVIDHQPKKLSEFQKNALKALSKQVVKLAELHKKNLEIAKYANENERLLERKINERTKELIATNTELKALNKQMEQIMYIASHDLQEPLRKTRVFLDMIKLKFMDRDLPLTLIEKMEHTSERMESLIKDILNFSKINEFNTENEEVNLNELFGILKSDMQLLVEEKSVTLKVNNLKDVKGDQNQLYQVFSNLISNAIKYNKNKPIIQVKGREIDGQLIDREGKFYEISVVDNGIGFDTQFKDKIFDFFQRLHLKNEYMGTGIGLAIVKKIVERHQGVVSATSIPDEGSTFQVYLPLK